MNFMAKFKYFAIASAVIIIAGIILGVVMGPNLGIDFAGGTLMTIEMGGEFELNDVTAALKANGISDAPAIKSGALDAANQTQAVVRFKSTDTEVQQKLVESLKGKYPNAALGVAEHIGTIADPVLMRNALLLLAIALILILIYVWIRFDLLGGVAAIVCLLHDVLLMLALVVLLRVQVNTALIGAVLVIVCYSINNAMVVFDKTRENNKRNTNRKRNNQDEIINLSVNESLPRTINTLLAALITIGCVYVLGSQGVKEFSLAIAIGLIVCAYSSIFIAAPLWNSMKAASNKRRR